MALLKAFKALRPVSHLVSKVAAPPYDVISSEEARRKVKNNPYSFLHVDKAEIDLSQGTDIYDEKVYQKAKENLKSMVEDGIFIKEKKDCLYIYRQTMGAHTQTGLVGCVSIDDYMNNIIKKHEETRKDKEVDRIKHVKYCNANTGPIFLTYKAMDEIDEMINGWADKNNPLYKFESDDNIGHTVWVIDDEDVVKRLVLYFEQVDILYIADGHHRSAAAVEVGKMRRKENPDYTGSEEFNYFLGVLFPHNKLKILDYNRVVKDLNGYSFKEFLKKVEENFIIEEYKGKNGYKPDSRHKFGMYIDRKWYKLIAKEDSFDSGDLIDSLDVSILQNNLLSPILGIKDPRKDKRIDFVGGIRGLEELERRVNAGESVAFSMHPTKMEEIMNISDKNMTMPPKSTWFEPKLRSGLFIHELE